eukprot:TRINITY_DN26216_c0_g1_i1.p1 TRINITY_DN26216_c0_g1~~TRINITY_DN26216_c0_g1_i1.p1  ORF type:complete len:467 (-),score=91.26 TRINITY_DN26216_c0_g1_i1:1058-2458(-)
MATTVTGPSSLKSGAPSLGSCRAALERAAYEACRANPEGADFLITAFAQALRSYRRPTVCAPFPTFLFQTQGPLPDKDFCAAEAALQQLPAIPAIASSPPPLTPCTSPATCPDCSSPPAPAASTPSLSSSPLEQLPLPTLRLLLWVLAYRSGARVLKEPARDLASQLPPTTCPFPARAIAEREPHLVVEVGGAVGGVSSRRAELFEKTSAAHGSFWAFHGTPAENLHSILRCGLLNMSGSREQKHGAIFGEGIYLSTDIAVALSFCSASPLSASGEGGIWLHSAFGARPLFLLCCQVANAPQGVTRSHQDLSGDKHSPPLQGAGSRKGKGQAERDSGNQELDAGLARLGSGNGERMREGTRAGQGLGTYVLVQDPDMVCVRYVFVYPMIGARPLAVSPSPLHHGAGRAASSSLAVPVSRVSVVGARLRSVDWCRVLLVSYAVMLVGSAVLKEACGGGRCRLSCFDL